MTGATLALALNNLSKGTLSVAVVEPFKVANESHPGFDARSIALSYGTRLILESFHLWAAIEPLTTAINHIQVSDRGHIGITEIDKVQQNVPALGYVVELADVGRLYERLLANAPAITCFCPDAVQAISRTSEQTSVLLESGETLSCKLLVSADGAESTCCQLLGHANSEHDFNQVAVITNVEVAEAHKGRAFERFTTSGPLALLPMSDNRMSVVWCMSPEAAARTERLSEDAFIDRLQNEFGWRLGRILKKGSVACYPLILKKKDAIVSHRFATVGNAAQLLHPIAGQGFNLGIRDIASLVEKVLQQNDVGEHIILSAYRKCREKDRNETIALITGLVHLFSNHWPTMSLPRNLALIAMDNIHLLKVSLLKRTMGLVER